MARTSKTSRQSRGAAPPGPPQPNPSPTPEAESAFNDPPPDQSVQTQDLDPEAIANAPEQEDSVPPQRGAGTRDPGTFFSRLHTDYTEADWREGRVICYLYRLQPVIDRTTSGQQHHFCAKYTAPIDIDDIMTEHGSGMYRMMLNYAQPGAVRGKCVDAALCRIFNQKYPPQIPAGEWMDDPRNKQWQWARQSAATAAQTQTATAAPADPIAFAERMLASVDRRVQQQVGSQQPQPNVLTGITPLLEVIAKATSPGTIIETMRSIQGLTTPQQENGETLMIKLLTEMNAQLRQEVRELRDSVMNSAKSAPGNKGIMEQLRELGESRELLKGFVKSMTGEAAPAGWDEVLPGMVKDIASEVLPAVPILIQGLFSRNAAPAPPAAAPPSIVYPPSPQTNAAPSTPAASPAPPGLGSYLSTLAEIQPVLLRYVNAGMSGGDFADWFEQLYGGLLFSQLTNLGADRIVLAFRLSPVWPQLQAVESQFREFVADFCAWQPPADDNLTEAQPAPTDAADTQMEDLT
jgi:hypothetical protein